MRWTFVGAFVASNPSEVRRQAIVDLAGMLSKLYQVLVQKLWIRFVAGDSAFVYTV